MAKSNDTARAEDFNQKLRDEVRRREQIERQQGGKK